MKKSWIVVGLLFATVAVSGCEKKESTKETINSHSSSSVVARDKKAKKKKVNTKQSEVDSSTSNSSIPKSYVASQEKNVTADSAVSKNEQVQTPNTYYSQNAVETTPSAPAAPASQPATASTENSADQQIQEVINYFEAAKQNAIARKRDQVNSWKASGEIDWSDDVISSGLTEFSSSLGDAADYYIYPYDQAIQKIDANMQTAHEIRMVK